MDLVCVNAEQLRKALADIEVAEENGFQHCLSVFWFVSRGNILEKNRIEYLDLCEKAHPTDPSLDWGRGQWVTRRNRFENGELVPIKGAKRSYTVERDWEHAGCRCVIVGAPMGHRCGYVGIQPSHPLHGVGYSAGSEVLGKSEYDWRESPWASPEEKFMVHGGITYSGGNDGYPVEGDDLWWFGFDAAHRDDAQDPALMDATALHSYENCAAFRTGEIRTAEYMAEEVERLAEQLAAIEDKTTRQ